MFHQDRSRLNRENVVLTREINELRRKAKALALQQDAVEKVRPGTTSEFAAQQIDGLLLYIPDDAHRSRRIITRSAPMRL